MGDCISRLNGRVERLERHFARTRIDLSAEVERLAKETGQEIEQIWRIERETDAMFDRLKARGVVDLDEIARAFELEPGELRRELEKRLREG